MSLQLLVLKGVDDIVSTGPFTAEYASTGIITTAVVSQSKKDDKRARALIGAHLADQHNISISPCIVRLVLQRLLWIASLAFSNNAPLPEGSL